MDTNTYTNIFCWPKMRLVLFFFLMLPITSLEASVLVKKRSSLPKYFASSVVRFCNWSSSSFPSVGNAKTLLKNGLIKQEEFAEIQAVEKNFATKISPVMHKLIQQGNNPITQQFVPTPNELNIQDFEREDPIGDEPFTVAKGLVHRYPDRCLLKVSPVCAVYCRFCFRKEMIGSKGESLTEEELEVCYDYIRNHPNIWEVIFTGGDPLVQPPSRLRKIFEQLHSIKHVAVLRMHTRVPIVDPKRINDNMIQALKVHTPTYVVLHANHPSEFTSEAKKAIDVLVDNGIPMYSQSVLLKGINDDERTLKDLMKCFIKHRIKPYYLHHPDLVKGTNHFRVDIETGQRLMKSIRGEISGLCQPTYVLDIPGGHGKSPIGALYLTKVQNSNHYMIEDYQGNQHLYDEVAKT